MPLEIEADVPPAVAVLQPTESAAEDERLLTVIRPPRGWQLLNLGELWRYRELLYFLTWREVKVRYKQTVLGAAWAILQPLLMMIVFTVFFGRMANVNTGGIPYPLFAFAGLLPWTFFSTAISNAGNSIVGSERLITKVYFPRLAVPFASIGAALVDFCVAFGMLLVLMLYYRVVPTWGLLLVPILVALMGLAAVGVGTLLAALNVAYRDFRYVIPFLVQLWMFATPTVYMQPEDYAQTSASSTTIVGGSSANRAGTSATSAAGADDTDQGAVPNSIQHWLNLNPVTALIAAFRSAVLGQAIPWRPLGYATLGVFAALLAGCFYFRRVEGSFADVI